MRKRSGEVCEFMDADFVNVRFASKKEGGVILLCTNHDKTSKKQGTEYHVVSHKQAEAKVLQIAR